MSEIKILIADDHLLFVEGVMTMLQHIPEFTIVEVVDNGKALLNKIINVEVDLILLDINMPFLDGIETLKQLKEKQKQVKVIMLSTYSEGVLIDKAKEYGANGYLLKNCSKEELIQTIHLVLSGKAIFPYTNNLKNNFQEDGFVKKYSLTKRELEILLLLKNNHTNQEIANQLFLSIYTVETHRKNIMQKIGVNNPAALMRFIMEQNI
jgi:two-component system, NarL family, nitrate/nitrite response regulator NarL